MRIPEERVVKAKVQAALADFQICDKYLLECNLNERTISHSLAVHLMKRFRPWDVDCEYNRDYGVVKSLCLPIVDVDWTDTEAKTVYPDIIIHKRGEGPNVLVVEMKKKGRSSEFDKKKLRAYKEQVGYEYACLIWINASDCRLEDPKWL